MNIHYIVAFYLGPRDTLPVNDFLIEDRYHYVKKHIECLKKFCCKDITKITFVVSEYDKKIDSKVDEVVKKHKGSLPIEVFHRENIGFSYAAWNDVMMKSLNDKEDFDYCFLIEDDYIPNCDYFYTPFTDLFDDKTAFVCQVWNVNHPSVSNGVFSYNIAKKLKEKYGSIFKLVSDDDSYSGGVENQIHYIDYARQEKYYFTDVRKTSLQIFLDRNHFVFFGNPKGEILIVPESTRDWKLALRDEKEGKWRNLKGNELPDELLILKLNKIRNSRANEFSKNPIHTSQEEAEEFFFKNFKNSYVIYNESNNPHAYIVFMEETKEEAKMVFHITKRWDGQTYLHKLSSVINWWVGSKKVKRLYCEIAEKNEFLLSSAIGLGFNKEYVKKDAIERNGKTEDIIGLSLLIEKSTIS
jgi:hypothetical protein